MKFSLIIVTLLLGLSTFSQKGQSVKLADGPAHLKIFVRMKPVPDMSSFVWPAGYQTFALMQHVFDQRQYAVSRYLKGNITRDSLEAFLENMKSSIGRQVMRETNHSIYVFIGMRQDSSFFLIADNNSNRDFTDDKVYRIHSDSAVNTLIQLDGVFGGKEVGGQYAYCFTMLQARHGKMPTGEPGDALYVAGLNSKMASFRAGTKRFQIELIQGSPSAVFGMQDLNVNLSRPDDTLKTVDYVKTIAFSARADTIISGAYRFWVAGIDETGSTVTLNFAGLGRKKYGYDPGYYLPDLSVQVIQDTLVCQKTINSLKGNRAYLLLDFWGTWCAPCIRSFPALDSLSQEFKGRGVGTVGIACEHTDNIPEVIRTARSHHVTWPVVYVNKSNHAIWTIADHCKISSYPTYILLDRNLKILLRETGTDGLNRIRKWLDSYLQESGISASPD